MKTAIVAVGDELLRNTVRETNSIHITAELKTVNVRPDMVVRIGDSECEIQNVLRSLDTYELIIITGGLGPTHDDLTLKAVMDYYVLGGNVDQTMWKRIRTRLESRGVPVSESNRKQAILPEKGCFIINDNGTAPGIIIEHGRQCIMLLPGPPGENLPMFKKDCLPLIQKMTGKKMKTCLETLYICDVSESAIADTMYELDLEGIETGIYFSEEGWITVEMRCEESCEFKNKAVQAAQYLKDKYHDMVVRGCEPSRCLFSLLKEKGLTISMAESLTGGYATWNLVRISGASEIFNGSATVYSNRSKNKTLNVPERVIREKGAVSEETAKAMAEGCRSHFETDYAISFTGIAGPSGAAEGKPAGTVYTAFASADDTFCVKDIYSGGRERVVKKAVAKAFCRMIARLS